MRQDKIMIHLNLVEFECILIELIEIYGFKKKKFGVKKFLKICMYLCIFSADEIFIFFFLIEIYQFVLEK